MDDSIAMRTRSGKKKPQEIDRISDLPDSILCQILSLLPTKYAVATSILSTRWKRLFPSFWVPPIRLQFDDSMLYNHSRYELSNISSTYDLGDIFRYLDQKFAFRVFVSELLRQPYLAATGVDTVNFSCERVYDHFEIRHWIDDALALNVKHLSLSFYSYNAVDLFVHLNGRTCLESLDINIRNVVKLNGNFSLPNLKRLSLGELTFYGESPSLSELIAGCPMLEDLDLYGCDFQCIDIVIRSPLLKYFRILGCTSDSRYRLDIDAPNLEELMLLGCLAARNYRLSTFKSLRKACVDIARNPPPPDTHMLSETELEYNNYFDADGDKWYFDNGVSKIVTACSSTHVLFLDDSAMDALHYSSLQLPAFENLSWLSIDYLGCNGWDVLACLLHCATNLKELTFQKEFRDEGSFAEFESLVPSPPICLELQFKEIEFCEFQGKEEEIKLLAYFLKHGKVLEKAILHAHPSMSSSIAKKLHTLPSHSKIFLYQEE